jgi:hypothetical protein
MYIEQKKTKTKTNENFGLGKGRDPLNNILIIVRAAPNHPSFSGYATNP